MSSWNGSSAVIRYLYIVRHDGRNVLIVVLVPDQGHDHRDIGTKEKLVVLADEERDLGRAPNLVLVKEHLVVNKARDADNTLDVGQNRILDHLTVNHDLLDLSRPHLARLDIPEAVGKLFMKINKSEVVGILNLVREGGN